MSIISNPAVLKLLAPIAMTGEVTCYDRNSIEIYCFVMAATQTRNVPYLLIEDGFLKKQSELFQTLVETIDWETSMSARKTASFGVPYNYVQMTYAAVPMHPALMRVSDRLFDRLGIRFNNCLLNYYETGYNRMGFHADDTTGLQPGTGVAIVSVGSPRAITYRHKSDPELRHKFTLQPGSLLYMESAVQEDWFHAINRQKGVGPRISLTWRLFKDSDIQ